MSVTKMLFSVSVLCCVYADNLGNFIIIINNLQELQHVAEHRLYGELCMNHFVAEHIPVC